MDQPGNPEQHPSNELHDAAYPVSDYQPRNLNGNVSTPNVNNLNVSHPSPSEPGPSSSSSSPPQDNPSNSKYTELATPALAFTSGQASSSWHGPGPAHLENSLDPPPSYEQSQSHSQTQSNTNTQTPPLSHSHSHSQSRPTTSSQPSVSNPSIIPPNLPPSNNAPSPQSVPASSPNLTPLQPIPTYHPAQSVGSQEPNGYPPPAPNGAPVYGPMPAIGYQKPERPTTLDRLRRKSCYTTLLLIGVFLLALFVGLMIGFRDQLDDEDEPEEDRRSGSNQLYREAENHGPTQPVQEPEPTETVVVVSWSG